MEKGLLVTVDCSGCTFFGKYPSIACKALNGQVTEVLDGTIDGSKMVSVRWAGPGAYPKNCLCPRDCLKPVNETEADIPHYGFRE